MKDRDMSKTIIVGSLAALALVAAGGVAIAQQQTPQQERPHRGAQDTDGDGRISQAEFVSGRVSRLTTLDANRDGAVAREEMQAGREARRDEMAGRRFDRLDANDDGAISRTEFDAARDARPQRGDRAGRPGRGGRGPMMEGRGGRGGERGERGPVVIAEVQTKLGEHFSRLDADRDGYLTEAERQAAREQMRETRRERRQERRAERRASQTAPASE